MNQNSQKNGLRAPQAKHLLLVGVCAFFILLRVVWGAQFLQASWYYLPGQIMANGKEFRNEKTCATRLYPLKTMLKITNLANKKWVVVCVTDRINKRWGTTRIDLTKKAFQQIGDLDTGIIPITVEVVKNEKAR